MLFSLMSDPERLVKNVLQEAENDYDRFKGLLKSVYEEAEPQTGQTPKEVIWTKNKAKLYRYHPVKENLHPTPILMVYALINRPYVLDLYPGMSLVEYLVNQGFDVYLLDWGIPGPEDSFLKFDDYVLDYLAKAVNKVIRTSGSDQLTMLGYCMGGTITCMYAALEELNRIKNIVLFAAPFDCSDAGLFSSWLRKEYFNVDKVVDTLGNIPGDMIDYGNKMLKAMPNFYGSYAKIWEKMWDERAVENWRVLNKWVTDGIPFAGEAFRQWIKEFYQENKLVKGQLKLNGKLVDLAKIKCPVLNVVAEKDHIVLPNQSIALGDYVGSSNYELFSVEAGHVSLVVGRPGPKILWPKVNSWLKDAGNKH